MHSRLLPLTHRVALAATLSMRVFSAAGQAPAHAPTDPLADGFANPPADARPLVWWHWMDGNITRTGIDQDLAWFSRMGLGGVQNFDAGLSTPTIVKDRIRYGSPAWRALFHHAVEQADAQGLSYGTAASPGWSETGGPWVPPQDAMKKLVWSQSVVAGGQPVDLALPALPRVAGPYQKLARGDGHLPGGAGGIARDTLVLAYPLDEDTPLPVPSVAVSGYPIDGSTLMDDDAEASISVPAGTPEQPTDITLSFDQPQAVASATVFLHGAAVPFQAPRFVPTLEARVDGAWRTVATLPIEAVPTTVSFTPIQADAFRLVLVDNPHHVRPVIDNPAPGVDVGVDIHGASRSVELTTFALSSHARVHRFESKAGFSTTPDYYQLGDPAEDTRGVDPTKILDLTKLLRADGSLHWTPPPGRWRVLRLGYSLLGTTNHPAPAEATGLEVDKYDPKAVERYFSTYLQRYKAAVGPALFGKRGLQTIVTDSIESGNANWTPTILADFRRLRGYDPTPFLPALTGVVVDSRSASDGFLYDWRRTLAELLASAHYGTIARMTRAEQLTLFGEALETGRPQLGDDLAMRSHADIPMAALWTFNPALGPNPAYVGDMRGAASVAHVYGRRYAAAETMTAGLASYAFAPSDLKRVIDLAFANGINRPVIHSSVHQPSDDAKPGLTLSGFGQYFNRHETWAEYARPWVDYIARSSFLLQQGQPVADVAYFIGEEAPVTAQWANGTMGPASPANGYDYINADMLMHTLSVDHGELVTRAGTRYRVLYLGGSSARMTVPTLRALARLVQAGATVIGTAPAATPSLADRAQDFQALTAQLWTDSHGAGLGRVIATRDLAEGLARAGVAADLSTAGTGTEGTLAFVHRQLPDGHLYFLHTTAQRPTHLDADFRVSGRAPEIWRADTGQAQPASYRMRDGRTVVSLDLQAEDALFVLFRNRTGATSGTVPTRAVRSTQDLSANWKVQFLSGASPPPAMEFGSLVPWNRSDDPRVRYYAGSAVYTRQFQAPIDLGSDTSVTLDLGEVGDLAQVTLNGQVVDTAWHAPFRLDITQALHPGTNDLRIEVANLWVNRLIGDAQPGATVSTFTSAIPYSAGAPLRPSGLLGPVRLIIQAQADPTQTP